MSAASVLTGPRSGAPSGAGARPWLVRAAVVLAGIAGVLTLALAPPTRLAPIVAGLFVALLVLKRPIVGIALVLVSVPFGTAFTFGGAAASSSSAASGSASGLAINASEIMVALVAVAWALRGVRLRSLSIRPSALAAAIVLVVLLMLASITWAISGALAIKEALKWLELLVIMVVTIDEVREDRRRALFILGALLLAGSLEAAYGLFQFATNRGPSSFDVSGALRAYGNFNQPNPFAGYLGTILPLAGVLALAAPIAPRLRVLAAGAGLVVLGGIAISQSRGAQLGVLAAAVVMLVVWSHRTRLLLVPLIAAGAVAVLAAVTHLIPASMTQRIAEVIQYFGVFDVRTVELTPQNFSVVERMAHWQAGWYMFLAHPWLGVGAGNYAAAYPDYYVGPWLNPLGHAHNYYLNTMAELGVVGLALLVLVLWLVFRIVLGGVRFPVPAAPRLREGSADALFWRAVLAGILGSLVVFCTHNVVDNLFVHSINAQLGCLFGLAIIGAERVRMTARASDVAR